MAAKRRAKTERKNVISAGKNVTLRVIVNYEIRKEKVAIIPTTIRRVM